VARRAGRAGDADGRQAVQAVNLEDAVAWYGDTAVPRLADASGFCAALLYADWASGRLISETVWQDPQALAASRSTATAGEAAAALNGVIGASKGYRLAFGSARLIQVRQAFAPPCAMLPGLSVRPVRYCLRNFAFSASTRC
jgi:hypothetical protein